MQVATTIIGIIFATTKQPNIYEFINTESLHNIR